MNFFSKDKKGLSAVIAALLLILLVTITMVIVWTAISENWQKTSFYPKRIMDVSAVCLLISKCNSQYSDNSSSDEGSSAQAHPAMTLE